MTTIETGPDTLDRWLDALDPDDPEALDADGEYLREIHSLTVDGAPDPDLAPAVAAARDCGWSWAPIAVVLGTTRADALRRFA